MNNSQRAAAERLAKALQNYGNEQEEAAELLRELAAEPVQEPIAWLHDETGDFEPSHKPWMDDDEEWVPLYAAPQQPMRCPTDGGECGAGGYCRPEQRKPLTDKQIEAILDEFDVDLEAWKPLARAIERAITGEPT